MRNFYIALLLLVNVACSYNSKPNEFLVGIENTKNESIEIHDILMAQMGDLHSLKKDIIAIDSLHKNNDSLVAEIELADKAMWDWMHQFKMNYEGANDSLTFVYFENKLSSINQVKIKFDSAFAHGRDYLDQR